MIEYTPGAYVEVCPVRRQASDVHGPAAETIDAQILLADAAFVPVKFPAWHCADVENHPFGA
ncbi:MAG TPA: hypothetical protein PK609_03350 [Candidatus Paceibacterota bacterium]|jgi:hypothetical protein|nr:hypothetical protein [Candidatus Paceibacterota bacterium]